MGYRRNIRRPGIKYKDGVRKLRMMTSVGMSYFASNGPYQSESSAPSVFGHVLLAAATYRSLRRPFSIKG